MTDSRKRTVSGIPIPTDPPPPSVPVDGEYVRNKLHSISQAQAKQAKIEAERTGASKQMSKIVAIFGSLITAAAIGGFVWVWDAHLQIQSQDNAIDRINERALAHNQMQGHASGDDRRHAIETRIYKIEHLQQAIQIRLDQQNEKLEIILRELRRRNRRLTWGN